MSTLRKAVFEYMKTYDVSESTAYRHLRLYYGTRPVRGGGPALTLVEWRRMKPALLDYVATHTWAETSKHFGLAPSTMRRYLAGKHPDE